MKKNTIVTLSTLTLSALLSACGTVSGTNDDATTTTTTASTYFVLGQSTATANSANAGSTASASTLSAPTSVYSNGTSLFAADTTNNRILIWSTIPTATGTAASLVVGQATMTITSATTTQSGLSGPKAVCLAGSKLIGVDTTNNRLLIWNTIPTANSATASVVVGQTLYTTATAATSATGLSGPVGCYSDGTKLFIADKTNNRVIIHNTIPTAVNATASVVVGQTLYTTSTAATTANGLKSPSGVFSDGTKFYVADTGNHRVLIYNTVPTAVNATASVVLGQASMTAGSANAGGSAATASTMSSPTSVWVVGGKLYVADTGNNRVLVWNTVPTATVAADSQYGQTDLTGSTANAGAIGESTVSAPSFAQTDGTTFFVADTTNNRIVGVTPSP